MKGRLFLVACLAICVSVAGCGGGSSKVSSASLQPRLLPRSSVPGFGLQRTLDWTDPVNLVGEGLFLPERTHPSEAVAEFNGAHLQGAAGEVLSRGAGFNETDVRIGVAQFDSEADANGVRDWMHRQDLQQPCYSQCVFSPGAITVPGIPSARFVVQSSKAPPLPSGAPPGAKVLGGQANYLAEFTVGPRLYWANLSAGPQARAQFEAGIRLYYAHAKQA